MNRPKYKSKLRRKTITKEKNLSKALNDHIKYNLNIKNEPSDVNYLGLDTTDEIKNIEDQLSKADDNDELNRNSDHLRWIEREYNRLKNEHFEHMVNRKDNCTFDHSF